MITPAKTAPPWLKLIWLLLLVMPGLWIAALIFHYGVDLPDGDEWDAICPLFLKMHAGTLHAADFYAFHNEHRIIFPRLLCFALGLLNNWNIRAELFLIWGLAGLCSFNLWQLSRATGWRDSRAGAWLFIAANALLFTPTQFETWLLGIEVAFLVPVVCVTACLWIPLVCRPVVAFPAAISLSIISTFSLASGFSCWLLAFPLLSLRDGKPAWRDRRGWWALWLGTCAASILIYFHGYQKPAQHPSETTFLHDPLIALQYLFTYLGGDFALGIPVAGLAGGILCLVFAGSAACLWVWRGDRRLLSRALPWLLLGGFALANAAMTTVGRVGFGIPQALASRYILFSILLPISLLFVIPLLLEKVRSRSPAGRIHPALWGATLTIAAAFAFLHLLNSVDSLEQWAIVHHNRLIAKAALSFINTVEEPPMLAHFVHQDVAVLEVRANALNELGDLRPPLLRSASIRDIANPTIAASAAFGAFEKCGKTAPGKWTLVGWAILPEAVRPADAVLLTYDDPQGNPVVFDLATAGIPRTDVVAATHEPAYLRSGWQHRFEDHLLPPGARTLKVWAYDAERGHAWQVKGEVILAR